MTNEAQRTDSPGKKPTAIVAALPEELAPLLGRTRVSRKLRLGRTRVSVGTLGRIQVVLAVTGDGAEPAERGLRALLEHFSVERLVLVGISGGLSPALVPGTLVAARAVWDGRDTAPPPDADWLDRLLSRERLIEGTIVSTERILCSAEEKAEVRASVPQAGPATVDLESAAYARVAAEKGVPYIAIRAVCDTAGEALPLDFNDCRDRSGKLSRARVLGRALLSPATVGGLWELRKRVTECADKLACTVDGLLNEA